MLQMFRNFFKSKVGVIFTLGFLALIAFAFASSDALNNAVLGGVSGGVSIRVTKPTDCWTRWTRVAARSAESG